MNHRIGRGIFALLTSIAVAYFAFQWVTDPQPRTERAREEQVVKAARSTLRDLVASPGLEIVDPLLPNRKVGKAYVYREPPGWAVSGYYRRGEEDAWHPYLIDMNDDLELQRFKVKDASLMDRVASDARLEVLP